MKWVIASLLIFLASAAGAEGEENNIWIMWEHLPQGRSCAGDDCKPLAEYRSHFLMNVPPTEAGSFFNGLRPTARTYGSADLTHDRLPLCYDDPAPPDHLKLDYAERLDTLRGITAIYADLRGVRGPANFKGQFGEEAQEILTKAFKDLKIEFLTKEAHPKTPGRPKLSLRYSPEVHGCKPWSVSLALSQDVHIARDFTQILSTSTWSASQRQSEADADFTAKDALRGVIEKFVSDWKAANAAPVETEG